MAASDERVGLVSYNIILGFSFVVGQLIAILTPESAGTNPWAIFAGAAASLSPTSVRDRWQALLARAGGGGVGGDGRYPWAGEFLERVRTERRWPDELMEELQTIHTGAEAIRQ